MTKIGDRVGAIQSASGDTVRFFGYGTYHGDVVPPAELGVQIFGEPMDVAYPCILLESGKQVFGCECWWGPEELMAQKIAMYKNVVIVDVEEARSQNDRA